ncbi:MAG: haloalkane dehalogenase, partial [Thermomicrobiales bacterium]
FQEAQRGFFQALRSPAGEAMVLEQNLFLEQLLPGGVIRKLSDEEMAAYRRPFAEPGEGRRSILTLARQLPIDGDPADVTEIVGNYADWLSHSRVPKLFINGEPGAILTESRRDFCRTWPHQTEVTVPGLHFLQEDSPDEIGRAVTNWLKTLP